MRLSKLLSAAAVAAIISLAVLAPKTSEAGTAANATIRNEVTVKYQNAAGTQMDDKTATVDITILLKPATPTLTLVGGNTATIALDGSTDYTYNITTNANGPDNYTLAAALTDMADVGVTPSTVEFRTAIGGGGNVVATVDLGATTAAAAAAIPATTQTSVTVLRDGGPGAEAGKLNKIEVGDTVVFGASATVCTVNVVNAATGYGTTTMEVTCPLLVNVALGDQIREVQTVYLHVDPAAILPSATGNQTIAVNTTAQDTATVAVATGASATSTTVLVSQMTVLKYVRNVSGGADEIAGNLAGATSISVDTDGVAKLYYLTGVKGKPGNTLEYVIAVSTTAGGGAAQDVKISDPLNSFITYVPGSMKLDPGTGTVGAALADGHNTPDAAEFDTTNNIVYIYAGTGGLDSGAGPFGTGTGGTLAAGTTSYGVYRVTIN